MKNQLAKSGTKIKQERKQCIILSFIKLLINVTVQIYIYIYIYILNLWLTVLNYISETDWQMAVLRNNVISITLPQFY